MKSFLYNIGYFIKETCRIIRLNMVNNLFSFLGTVLILFILCMVLTAGEAGNRLVEMLSDEAEINAYFKDGLSSEEMQRIISKINQLEGIRQTRLVSENEAYESMEKILGDEADILELFEENPFESFVEIRIHMENRDTIIQEVRNTEGIDYVRDNKDVLDRIKGISDGLKILGYIVILAVGITTIIILSHMIRQGIYNNRRQINTMKLLGAPNVFIGFPYVLVGILMTLGGGIVAAGLDSILIHQAYDQFSGMLPFIPLPPKTELVNKILFLIPLGSLLFGIAGSLYGLTSMKKTA